MDIELISKITLIALFSLFSLIRIEYYRRARQAGYKTFTEERLRYAVWLSVLICYVLFTFFVYILFAEVLAWATLALPLWVRLFGVCLGFLSVLLLVWVYQDLDDNFSIRVRIRKSQYLITSRPHRWVRHSMYSAFYLLPVAVVLITANWFIGLTWLAGLTAIIRLRVSRGRKCWSRDLARYTEHIQRPLEAFSPKWTVSKLGSKTSIG